MTTSIKDEFIGKEAEIVRARSKQLLGLKGKIMDETRQSFKFLVNKGNFRELKMIMKDGNTFRIGNKLFEGSKLMKRPEDRIKLKDE
jgi:ribonuclease P protein subunit POP4